MLYFSRKLDESQPEKWRPSMANISKSWKKQGIWTVALMTVWIPVVLIGTDFLQGFYGSVGVTQTMITGVTSVFSLIYVLYQILWAASALTEEKTQDTIVSMLPGVSILASCFIIGLTQVSIAPDPVFWFINLIIVSVAFIIDLWVGNVTGNSILTLKQVETRSNT